MSLRSGYPRGKTSAMGLFDTVEVLDDVAALRCPEGHAARSFQTKDLDEPSMSTYLVTDGRLYLASSRREPATADDASGRWRIEGSHAIREHHCDLKEIAMPRTVRVYGRCSACAPVLVRADRPGILGDIVQEHELFLDFALTFRRGEPLQIERTSGTRDDLKRDLRARGVYVLEDDEPLSIAHREVQRAREVLEQHSGRRGLRW